MLTYKLYKRKIEYDIGINIIITVDQLHNRLFSYMKKEFINRIDEIIVFNSLDKEAISKILDKIISQIEKRLSNLKIHINLTDKARSALIDEGYDINFGARPLKREVSKVIENSLAKMIITDQVKENDTILVDYQNNEFLIK